MAVPKMRPTPAVTAIARAPQNPTRAAPTIADAPPVRAAIAPSAIRQTNEVTDTTTTLGGTTMMARIGTAAPAVKVAADANAACSGRAVCSSVSPNSSRCVCNQRILRHQLTGHLSRKIAVEPSTNVYRRKLVFLNFRLRREFASFAIQVGAFRVGLRADRYVFASGHRQCTRDETCNAGNEYFLPTRSG